MVPGHVPSNDGHVEGFRISPRAIEGLRLLRYAYDSARDTGSQIADFALGINELSEVGMRNCDLRWLIRKDYIQHLFEITFPGQLKREQRKIPCLRFFNSSCFVLTSIGAEFAKQIDEPAVLEPVQPATLTLAIADHDERSRPSWDQGRRQLSIRGQIVRRCRGRKSLQEILFIAFHEQGFSEHIDDPLRPTPGIDSRIRLYRVVYRLNKSIHPPLIRFVCDVGRTGVYWESLER